MSSDRRLIHNRRIYNPSSTVLHDSTYYQPTALFGDDGSVALFLYRVVRYVTMSGREIRKTVTDVMAFESISEVGEAIEEYGWVEGVVDDE